MSSTKQNIQQVNRANSIELTLSLNHLREDPRVGTVDVREDHVGHSEVRIQLFTSDHPLLSDEMWKELHHEICDGTDLTDPEAVVLIEKFCADVVRANAFNILKGYME